MLAALMPPEGWLSMAWSWAGMFASEIVADPPSGTTVTVGLVCICIGAFTKSAQYPFKNSDQKKITDYLTEPGYAGIPRLVVAGKTELERVREQVQNIE